MAKNVWLSPVYGACWVPPTTTILGHVWAPTDFIIILIYVNFATSLLINSKEIETFKINTIIMSNRGELSNISAPQTGMRLGQLSAVSVCQP